MAAILRILDANLNRAREALRVMEDAARFGLNHARLSGELKAVRHALQQAMQDAGLSDGRLEASRDAGGDVGAEIVEPTEMSRADLHGIVTAAGKRLTEALRVIEETLKIVNPSSARQMQALRYRAYTIDAQMQFRMGTGRARQWRLCVLLTQALFNRPWREVARGAIEGGADCIQVREKELSDRQLLLHVRDVIDIARPSGTSVIVNDRADIALAAGADGVHLGQNDLTVHDVRRLAGRGLLVGVSTHDVGEAQAAVEAGADYCGVGAMFVTALKPDRLPSGPEYMRQFIQRFPGVPHLAIGGITPQNAAEVARAGGRGIAVSTAICAASDPAEVARQLIEQLQSGQAGHNPSP